MSTTTAEAIADTSAAVGTAAARAATEWSGTLGRMPTGIPGLDHLLEGGLVRGNSLLIEGAPGSGKSTLALRVLYEGVVQYDEPGLIITFEEFPKQLYHDALQFGMDLRALERAGKLRVLWTPPGRILEGFTGKIDLVDRVIEQLGVRRLLIDSITHFKRVATGELELREVLAKILSSLKMKGINAFLIKELERIDDETIAFEEYLVDASIRLYNTPSAAGGENVRSVEIRKTRGQAHISGRHPFEMRSNELRIYPRLRPVDVRNAFPRSAAPTPERISVGIAWIDEMLHGGVWKGSLNLVSGQPGTGKSVITHHFLDAGLTRGEPGLLVTIRNAPEQILAQAAGLGMRWDDACASGALTILHFHPSSLCPEKMLDELVAAVRARRPARLVLESIDDLWGAVKDEDRVQDIVLVLASLFDAAGTTSLIMNERRAMSTSRTGEVPDYAHLARCVIQLAIANDGGQLRRSVAISKHAGSDHCKELWHYQIDEHGFHLDSRSAPSRS
jgi:circadian clock protein KaiC